MSSRSRPRASCIRMIDGKKCEPIERLVCDVPQEYVGAVIEKLGSRKGDLARDDADRQPHEARIPRSRRAACSVTATSSSPTPRARASWPSVFDSYAPYKGELARRNTGSLVASETGEASITYGLFNAQERGVLFIGAGRRRVRGYGRRSVPQAARTSRSTCARRSS